MREQTACHGGDKWKSGGLKGFLVLFLWVYAALNLVFLYYQGTFFIGNHDWDWVKGTTQVLSLGTGLFEGRYGKFVLNAWLFGGQVLPLLNTWLAFALLASGTSLLPHYWQIRGRPAQVMVALLPALLPFILGWLYFPINILGNFMAVPAVIGGLMLVERKGKISIAAGILCFLLALGVYPSVVETMAVCWAIRCLLAPSGETKKVMQSLVCIVLSLAAFVLLLKILTAAGVIYAGHYNMQTASPQEMLIRLPSMAALAWGQMVDSVPFQPLSLKMCGLLLVVSAIVCSLARRGSAAKSLLLWGAAIGATVLSAWLAAASEEAAYMPRVNFYGLNFVYAGAAGVLLSSEKNIWKNTALVFGTLMLLLAVNADMAAQKVWQAGKTAEEKLVERISARLEEQGAAQWEKGLLSPRIPVLAGELPLRPRYYHRPYAHPAPYVLNAPFIVRHIPSGMFNFYAIRPVFAGLSQIREITPAMRAFLTKGGEPWPSASALFLDENYAIILLTAEGKAAIQMQMPQ